jgi:predicted HicB family RNase H-like nuclease
MMPDMHNRCMGDFRIRHIPEPIHRQIKAFAALAGKSVNDYILDLLTEHVEQKKGKS